MENKKTIIYGFIIMIVIFLSANLIGSKIPLVSDFIPSSFIILAISGKVYRAFRSKVYRAFRSKVYRAFR